MPYIDPATIPVDLFLARSRLACCATCEAWGLRDKQPYCPRLNTFLLDDDFTTIGCQLWRREKYESYAVDLWADLVREGAK